MKKLLKALTILLVILLIAFTYGIVRSYGWPVVSTQDIVSDKIRENKKVCVISDLHSKHFSTLVSQIQEQNPDLIVMAGDIFDESDAEPESTLEIVKDLADLCPVYFAMGNHELKLISKKPEFMDRLVRIGVKVIDKEYYDFSDDLRIGGLYDYPFGTNKTGYNTADSASADVREYLTGFLDTDRFTLLTAHRPDSFYYSDASQAYSIDLVISAHIHGGQAVIPFAGGLYGGEQGWWPEYVHGFYKKNQINWLITSGLSTGKKLIPRFNNPPEIYIVNLISG